MAARVCLSAIIYLELQSSPIFKHVAVAYSCGSVLLWWRCDTLRTFDLWMTSYLRIIGHMQGCLAGVTLELPASLMCSQAGLARPWAVANSTKP